jgi:DNA-binding NtrC family response regulator
VRPLPKRSHPKRVLVVEDDRFVREALSEAMSDWGCEVSAAETVDQACALASGTDLDAVVSDIHLPGDGLSLPRRLHRISPRVPVVLITGRDGETGRQRALASGAFEYLLKPVDLAALKDVLSRAFERRAQEGARTARRAREEEGPA